MAKQEISIITASAQQSIDQLSVKIIGLAKVMAELNMTIIKLEGALSKGAGAQKLASGLNSAARASGSLSKQMIQQQKKAAAAEIQFKSLQQRLKSFGASGTAQLGGLSNSFQAFTKNMKSGELSVKQLAKAHISWNKTMGNTRRKLVDLNKEEAAATALRNANTASTKRAVATTNENTKAVANAREKTKDLIQQLRLMGGTREQIRGVVREFKIFEKTVGTDATAALIRLNAASRRTGRSLKGMRVRRARHDASRLSMAFKDLGTSAVFALGPLSGIGARLIAFNAIAGRSTIAMASIAAASAVAVFGMIKLAAATVKARVEFDKIIGTLRVSSGSMAGAQKSFRFVTDVARELGIEVGAAALQFGQLRAAAMGSGASTAQVEKIFTAVATASSALRLSTEQTTGAFRAIQQMFSKGTVQAEELRGQLGERLPGAFNLAAQAMGVTTRELGKMLENGEVLATDLLPRLADVLLETFGSESKVAASDLSGELAKLNTEIFLLLVATDRAAGVSDKLTVSLREFRRAAAGLRDDSLSAELVRLNEELKTAEDRLTRGINPAFAALFAFHPQSLLAGSLPPASDETTFALTEDRNRRAAALGNEIKENLAELQRNSGSIPEIPVVGFNAPDAREIERLKTLATQPPVPAAPSAEAAKALKAVTDRTLELANALADLTATPVDQAIMAINRELAIAKVTLLEAGVSAKDTAEAVNILSEALNNLSLRKIDDSAKKTLAGLQSGLDALGPNKAATALQQQNAEVKAVSDSYRAQLQILLAGLSATKAAGKQVTRGQLDAIQELVAAQTEFAAKSSSMLNALATGPAKAAAADFLKSFQKGLDTFDPDPEIAKVKEFQFSVKALAVAMQIAGADSAAFEAAAKSLGEQLAKNAEEARQFATETSAKAHLTGLLESIRLTKLRIAAEKEGNAGLLETANRQEIVNKLRKQFPDLASDVVTIEGMTAAEVELKKLLALLKGLTTSGSQTADAASQLASVNKLIEVMKLRIDGLDEEAEKMEDRNKREEKFAQIVGSKSLEALIAADGVLKQLTEQWGAVTAAEKNADKFLDDIQKKIDKLNADPAAVAAAQMEVLAAAMEASGRSAEEFRARHETLQASLQSAELGAERRTQTASAGKQIKILEEQNAVLLLRLDGLEDEANAMERRNALEREFGEILGSSTVERLEEVRAAVEANREAYKAVQEEQKRMDALAGEFASTITGGLKDMIFAGDSFVETLDNIATKLAEITLDALVFDPLQESLKGAIGSSSAFGSIFGRGEEAAGEEATTAAVSGLATSAEKTAAILEKEFAGGVVEAAAGTAILATVESTATTALAELAIAAGAAAIALESMAAAGAADAGGGILGTIAGAFGGTSGPGPEFAPGSAGRAHGGRVGAGEAVMVGERGPEPFIPDTSGMIVSNQNFRKVLGTGGDSVVNNLTMNVSVQDDVGFQRNQGQIMARASRALQQAHRRGN